MKTKFRIYICVLLCCVFFNVFSSSVFSFYGLNENSMMIRYNVIDVLAGNDISQSFTSSDLPNENFITLMRQSGVSLSSVSNGTYYLNNKFEGKFLRKATSNSVNSTAGLISELQSSIKWVITNHDSTYCIIKPYSDSSKCLAGSTSTSSSSVSLVSISSIIEDRCLWEITVADGGGCIIKNKHSGRVLFSNNSVITTQLDNTENYDKKVWRIVSDNVYTTNRELTNASFSRLSIDVGECDTPYVSSKTPSTAMWASGEDFVYTSTSSKIGINNDVYGITGISVGTAYITATHKVTGISKTVTVSISPLELYETDRRPGLEDDGSIARDMLISDLSKSQLTAININLTDLAYQYDLGPSSSTVLPPQGPEVLIKYMEQLPSLFAAGNSSMRNVVASMVDHFISGTGSDFTNSILTETVHNHQNTEAFITNTKQVINSALDINNGNIYSLLSSSSFLNNMRNIPEPAYNTSSDYLNGLKIALNGIWGYDIEITEYDFDGSNYSGTIKYTIFDHFGLDNGDITDSSITSELLGYTAQFGSWFVLQRYENCNSQYKPFVTVIVFEESFSGSI